MQKIILGLGSNRSFNDMSSVELLQMACKEICSIVDTPVFSSVYQTKAMYVENQEDFYNMVCIGYVPDDENQYEFLKKINLIESKYGRDRKKEIRFGPRSLDIDIEIFGKEIINDPVLQIPHPRIEERAFVLIPLLEILSESADKQLREKYENYLKVLEKQHKTDDIVKLYSLRVDQYGTGS